MLDLHRIYASASGRPSVLSLPNETLLLHPSSNSIIVRSAQNLSLVRVLAFQEAFPGTGHDSQAVSCLATDPGMKLVFAAASSNIAVWTLSRIPRAGTWRIHSTLRMNEGRRVTSMSSRSGLLAVTTHTDLSVYTLALEDDLPTWSLKWTVPTGATSLATVSPSLMYIATAVVGDNSVRIYLTSSGRPLQNIRHPRPIQKLSWRTCESSHRDDMALFTVTSDSTLRIYIPVIDSPQRLQLHASLDLFSCLPYPIIVSLLPRGQERSLASNILWLDHQVTHSVIKKLLEGSADQEASEFQRLQQLREGDWDLFLRVLPDGSMVLTSVANIDRRPPTLIRHFTMVHTSPLLPPSAAGDLDMTLVADVTTGPGSLLLLRSSPLTTHSINLLALLRNAHDAVTVLKASDPMPAQLSSPILRLGRTPDGSGLVVLRASGNETWAVARIGPSLRFREQRQLGQDVVVLDGGNAAVAYADGELALHTASPQSVSLSVPPLTDMFSLQGTDPSWLLGVGEDLSLIQVVVTLGDVPSLELQSHTCLPLDSPPRLILPVDPMAWRGARSSSVVKEDLLVISQDGELSFWARDGAGGWLRTGRVATGRRDIRLARCSSAKKTVLVVPATGGRGEELTIWDSKESEFASGLEYRAVLSTQENVNDLDWSATPDSQSILAVGYVDRIELLCEKRMSYFDEAPAWTVCWKIDVGTTIPHPISDSIWLANGALAVATGNIISLYTQSAPATSAKSKESLFEHVARSNGPLEDYNPQMLLQLLLWGKISLVRDIIVALAKAVDLRIDGDESEALEMERFGTDRYLVDEPFGLPTQAAVRPSKQREASLLKLTGADPDDEDMFSRVLVERLVQKLEAHPLPHMTTNEHAHLIVILQTTLEIDEQRRALDANGLRYLTSMRSFYILNSRSESSSTHIAAARNETVRSPVRRERLRYRDMIWAFHSESQGILLQASMAACEGKMNLMDAKALGVFLWLKSLDSVKGHVEVVARNQYMAGESRDPTACSLLYFALGKVKLVHGLWRQAAWHKEQPLMLKFLANDFSQDRWRTAALKNAFALMSKQRFEYAAAFFLLGGSLKDAVNVCIRNLSDFQLAIAIARVVEGGEDGPVFRDVLNKTVVPKAFKEGNRWLASWAFWLLRRRDLAVRVLVTPLSTLATALDTVPSDIGDPHYDDPSLALLFSQLKTKTLQTAKGTSEISGRTEFNFVLQTARVFVRMGCHALALDLVRSWSFERPSRIIAAPNGRPASPIRHRSEVNALMQRQPSVFIDMDVPSATPTRPATPQPNRDSATKADDTKTAETSDLSARKTGIGSLMKAAKQDVVVPEFDMGSFAF